MIKNLFQSVSIPNSDFLLKYKVLLLAFVMITLTGLTGWAQTTGDYRSVTTGTWQTLSTWQRYSGTAWSTPTSAQGWPGQNTGTNDITVMSGHVVTIGTGGITTQPFASINIQSTGRLYLNGTNQTVTFSLATSVLNIASGGDVYFFNKSQLVLSADAAVSMTINLNGLVAATCNNNAELFIGAQKYAVCAGAPGDIFTFAQLIAAGGTLDALPTSNGPICQGSTLNLFGNYDGAIGTTPTYSWSVTAPGGGTPITSTSQSFSIPNAITGTYQARLTVTTTLGGTTYTNSETLPVVVNALPTLTAASQAMTVCENTPATINLTGLVPNNTFSVTYKIGTGTPVTVTGLTSSATGTSSFSTVSLTTANNNQILEVTSITITNPSTNCATNFTGRTATLSVWTSGGGTWIGLVSSDWNDGGNWCSGVPTSTTDVFIYNTSSIPNQPTIGTAAAVCNNITIASGATLTMSNAQTLDVYGNWTNNGTLTAGNGTIGFVGSAAGQTIAGTGTNTFNNLTIDNTFPETGGVKAGGDLTVNGILNLVSASPNVTNGSLEMTKNYGDYSNIPTPVENLTTQTTQAHDILDSWILYMGATATTAGAGDVTGKVKRTTIAENIEYSFGSTFSTMTFNRNSTGTLPSAIMFVITKGSDRGIHANKPNAVARLYQIIRTGGDLPTTFNIKLRYTDDALNGNTESNLVLWDHHIPYNSANTPHEHGKIAQNNTDNWVSLIGHGINYIGSQEVIGGFTKYWLFSSTVLTANTWLGAVSGSQTVWDNASNWTGGHIPTCADNVMIPVTTYSPVLPSDASANSITIAEGATLNGGTGTLTLCGGVANNGGIGSWNNNGTFNPGTSTVVFNFLRTSTDDISNGETSTISGTANFYNMTLAFNTYMMIQSGANVSIEGAFTKTGNLDAGTYENTFSYTGADQAVAAPDGNYYHLTLSGIGTKTLPASALGIAGNLTLNAAVSVSGNTISMSGAAPQTIGGTMPATFNNLTINNASGVTLGNSQTVNGNLTLTSGLITTGANTLTHGCDGIITGQSATSYIDGKLARLYCGIGSKDFPIGKGGNYRPLSLEYTALTTTPSTVTAEQFENVIPGTLPANIYTQNRFWNITESGSTARTYSLSLNGDPFNPGTGGPVILKGNGTTNSAIDATYSSPDFTIAGQTTFSNFAVATECLPPTITEDPVTTSACAGSGIATFSVTATVPSGTPTYQWEESTTGTGGTFVAITNSPIYSNATTAALSINNPPYSMHGYAYRVVISRDCGSSITSDGVVLTVNELPTITLGASPSVCSGTISANLPYTAITGSPDQYRIDYDATAEAAGFTDVSTYTNFLESPIVLTLPSTVGIFEGTIYVKNSNNCESIGFPFTVTINELPQGSLTGNAICSGETGMLTWTATAGIGPFTVVYNDGEADRTRTGVVSGTPFAVFANPAITTDYTLVSVTGTHCPRTSDFTGPSATITLLTDDATYTWTGSESDDWNNAANWSSGFVPSSCINVIIPVVANFPTLYSAGACKNITIESGASLMDNSLLSIGGTASVERVIANDWKWHFISSPVTAQPIWPEFAPTPTDLKWPAAQTEPLWNWDFYYYNPNVPVSGNYYWVNLRQDAVANYNNSPVDAPSINAGYGTTTSPVMTVGRGYLVAYGPDYNLNNTTHTFTGTLNTGDIPRAILKSESSFNLVGNPYPSSIDWKVASGWDRTKLALNGTGYDYWIWNDAGTGNYGVFNSADASGTNGVTKDIAPMQAFFVRASGSGNLLMSNAVRVHSTQPWLKNRQAENNLLRLKLTTQANTYSDEMIVAFDPSQSDGGSDKFWSMYTEAPEIFSVKDGNNYSIDRYADISAEMVVNLGAKCGVESTYTLTATNISEFSLANHVYLTDLKTGIRINLKETGSYTFNGSPNDDVTRFKLTFAGTIGIEAPVAESRTEIYAHNGMIYITGLEVKADITVTNLLGQVVQRTMAKGNDLTILNAGNLPKGIYVVSVFSNGQSISRKVVL
ncbi:MAG: hypothetical protein CVT94_16970 [Bacteroidetes bacterium HGW-Bacteroidetes-11]|jgi:hypothetical protein|nr:MAG: hypothetical protein CVT94_16970 [Bacteroidetes bacterium HGW-Bacteroidetes-11]